MATVLKLMKNKTGEFPAIICLGRQLEIRKMNWKKAPDSFHRWFLQLQGRVRQSLLRNTEKYSALFALSLCKRTDLAALKGKSPGIKPGFAFLWLKAFWSKQNPEINSLFKKCTYVHTHTWMHFIAWWCQIIHFCQLNYFCRCLGTTCLYSAFHN